MYLHLALKRIRQNRKVNLLQEVVEIAHTRSRPRTPRHFRLLCASPLARTETDIGYTHSSSFQQQPRENHYKLENTLHWLHSEQVSGGRFESQMATEEQQVLEALGYVKLSTPRVRK